MPPVAARRPTTRTHHGDTFTDEYEWLRRKDDPEVVAHLEAENSWTMARLEHLAPLRQAIFDEIKARTQETDLSLPSRDGGWWYYSRTEEGKQYPIHARYEVSDPDDWTPRVLEPGEPVPGEQVLLDQNVEADGHDFFSLGTFDVSDDGGLLLYAVDTAGDERYTLRIRDLSTGTDLDDEVPGTAPGAFFAPDGVHVFYQTVDEAWRPHRLWRHRIGTSRDDDVMVFDEPDERYWMGAGVSRSKKYLMIELASKVTSECWILEADDPAGEFRCVRPRAEGVEYSVEHAVLPESVSPAGDAPRGGRDVLLVLHNENAENFELTVADVPGTGGVAGWGDVVVPHDPDVRLEGISASERYLVLYYRRGAIGRSGILRLDTPGGLVGRSGTSADPGAAPAPPAPEIRPQLVESGRPAPAAPVAASWRFEEIAFGQELESVGAGVGVWEQPNLLVGYTSFVTPSAVYDYDVATGERTLLKQTPVLGGFDPDEYAQRREWAVAEDGTRVPISLVWRKDRVVLGDDGVPAAPAPVLLYGYGAYEMSLDPYFSIPRLSLLERGVVFAIAHVRGGGEMGRRWYDGGKLDHKANTFTDYVACARHLAAAGWSTPERTVADGGSAGGLLVGAALNLAPDAFGGVLAGVPFVDALTSMLDPSLPLTVTEWDEWGDPLHDAAVYAYMKSYSPYENVPDDASHYPQVLATTSFNDTRVMYVEPAKWVARLRAAGAPALLKIEMQAGHGGVSGRYATWEQIAFEHAWILEVLGLAE
ncbi:S9 family peptidase [Myceligenerans salitolerans]|uniref:S9 family peptidase n=1 Tax=Myceligenerans salitolerans TaxID=1230528 RepID=A0ABS3I8Z0_9MICO|nr:S9 family peptidase [Myceligenerans salitolerans]MBO0609491.1 S9 family peptidase [Myceligenerans salitolerans]